MSVQPPTLPTPQGYGKAVIGGLVQPFAAALGQLVVAGVTAWIGHDPGATVDGALLTVVSTLVTVPAIILTPHNLFGA